MSAEYNIDLNNILGTGRDGRVLKEDVIAYMESQTQPKKAPAPTSAPSQQPAQAQQTQRPVAPKPAAPAPRPIVISGEDRTEPLKGIMKAMTKTM